jgi:hypothetical protein
MCHNRYWNLITEPNPMIDFRLEGDHYLPERFSSFQPDKHNIVTTAGQFVMSVCALTVKDCLRIKKLLTLPPTLDITRGTFFYIPKGTVVPCHKDEEAHSGYLRNNAMFTFNVSGPKSVLYVNCSGKNGDYGFLVSDYFTTTLNPTSIYHGVIADPDEDLYLIQFPISSTRSENSESQS